MINIQENEEYYPCVGLNENGLKLIVFVFYEKLSKNSKRSNLTIFFSIIRIF